jgi:type IV secretion system protein VirB6
MSSTLVAHWLLEDLVNVVTNYVNDAAANMIAIIGPAAASLLAIYVLLWGAGIASGQIQEPFTDGAKRILRMCVIISFALSVGVYQGSVAEFFLNAPPAMATEMTAPGSTSTGDPSSIADMLDEALGKGVDIGYKYWDKGNEEGGAVVPSMAAVGFYILAIIVWVSVAGLVALAAALVFVAFIALALLLAVGPLFIMLAIFPATQRFFELWLGQIVSYSMLYIMIAVAVGLCFALLGSMLDALAPADWKEGVINTIKILGASLAVVAVLLQTRGIAAQLGGGFALSAQGVAGRLASAGSSAGRVAGTGNSNMPVGRAASAAMSVSGVGAVAGRAVAAVGRARNTFFRTNSVRGT